MIAPREYAFRVISIGLQHEEQRDVASIAAQLGGKYEDAIDEMDLCRLAQDGASPICIIGQSDKISEPSYLVWLLKGIIDSSKAILIYSSMNKEEAAKLDRHEVTNVLSRPVDSNQLGRMLESAIETREGHKESFLSSLSRLNPFRKHSLAE